MTASGVSGVATHGRGVTIALWVLQVLLALFFLLGATGPKLLGQQMTIQMFDEIGLGQWFRYFVGLVEFAGAVGLLIPSLAGLAALGMVGVMAGAFLTQLLVPDLIGPALTPVVLLVLFLMIAWGRWPETKALLGKSGS
jgi:hypothetical protein